MAPPGKVIVNSSSPDTFGRRLPRGVIYLNVPHAELIGAEYEIMGEDTSEDSMWIDPERYCHEIDLVGDEGEDDTEETEEEGVEAPEEEIADYNGSGGGDYGGGGGGGYAGPGGGPFPPPTPASPPGVPIDSPGADPGRPTAVNPFASIAAALGSKKAPQPLNQSQFNAIRTIANFQKNLQAGNPSTIRIANIIRNRAKSSPRYAATFKAISNPSIGRRTFIHGEPVVGGSVSSALSSIIKTVLSPVGWGLRGVGTVSNEVGTQLNHLARKL